MCGNNRCYVQASNGVLHIFFEEVASFFFKIMMEVVQNWADQYMKWQERNAVPSDVRVLKREYFNRWYALNPFYAAHFVSKLPGQIFFGMIFNTLIYFLAGFPAETFRFAYFSLIGTLITIASHALGLAIGSIFNEINGSVLGPAAISPFLGLSVYGIDFVKDLSWVTRIILKLSYMRSGVLATMITIFGFDRPTLKCNTVYCHFKNPAKILQYIDAEDTPLWSEIGGIILFAIVFQVIAYAALRFRMSIK